MKRENVNSTNLKSVGFDPTSLVLEVEFHSGRIYEYLDVPKNKHASLMSATSKGTYFSQQIRDKYKCRRIR